MVEKYRTEKLYIQACFPSRRKAEEQAQHVNAYAWGKYTFQYPYLKLNQLPANKYLSGAANKNILL